MEKDEHNMELPKTWCGKLIVNLVWQIGNTTTEKQDHVLVTKEILPTHTSLFVCLSGDVHPALCAHQ